MQHEHVHQQDARRSAFEVIDRTGAAHPLGELRVSRIYDWGAPRTLPRFEAYDWGRRLWQRVDRATARQLARLKPEDLQRMLKTHARGLRVVGEFDDVTVPGSKLESALDAALAAGWLTMGHRNYRVRMSGSGNIRVESGHGTTVYTRSALLDALQRGHF